MTADVAPGWYAEAATITAGDPTLDSIVATPRKLAHRVEFSNEVIDDSDPSAVDVVRDNVIAALGLKLDLGIFAGSGTAPEIRGLRNLTGANEISKGVNGGTLALLDDFADAIKLLDDANATAGAIVLAPRTWNGIRKLKDTQNRYLVNAGTTDTPPSIFGVPVFVSSQISITETQGNRDERHEHLHLRAQSGDPRQAPGRRGRARPQQAVQQRPVGAARQAARRPDRPQPDRRYPHHRNHPVTPAKKVTVTVRKGAVVYHDGRAREAGETFEVTAAEAKALAEQGVLTGKASAQG